MKHALPFLLLLLLLVACGESHQQMVLQLEELERQNRADSLMLNDSLALRLADYFDRHGSANERLRAHYILGRTYADMGEAPAALSAYLDAADCADTTQADCDFRTLSRVHGQMADLLYKQNLMEDYIASCDNSAKYAWKEVKNGPYARPTVNQKLVMPKLYKGSPFIPFGQNAAKLYLPLKTLYMYDYKFNYIHYNY